MTVGKRTAAFICDEPPAPNQSGPSTYNHTILQGLIDLGYAVTVICTTRRFKAVVTRAPRVEAQVRYIHARQVGDLLVCVTPQAIARAGKAIPDLPDSFSRWTTIFSASSVAIGSKISWVDPSRRMSPSNIPGFRGRLKMPRRRSRAITSTCESMFSSMTT